MGCCQSHSQQSNVGFQEKIRTAIQSNSVSTIKLILSTPEVKSNKERCLELLEEPTTTAGSLKLSILAHSFFLGRSAIFQYLVSYGCSLNKMETLLESQFVPPMQIICSRGYVDLLTYYLPLYTVKSLNTKQEKSFTLDLKNDNEVREAPKYALTPIQYAVIHGNLNIINAVITYYKEADKIPFEFDLDYQEENTGENAALMACRTGNLVTVKYLHQMCGANFFLVNKAGENAIQIATSASKVKKNCNFLPIIAYLVESVEISVQYNYEETLLIACNFEIILYIEDKLKAVGIFITKQELENQNKILVPRTHEKKINNEAHKEFNFTDMFSQEHPERDDTIISSIFPEDQKNATSFLDL